MRIVGLRQYNGEADGEKTQGGKEMETDKEIGRETETLKDRWGETETSEETWGDSLGSSG